MLDIEEAVVERGELTSLCMPGLRAWIWRVDGEMHDFRHAGGPVLDEAKMRLIPVRIGNNVDGDDQSELARHFQGLHILIESDTLAVQSQRLLVQRLDAKKHVQESQTLPIGEDLTIAE